MTEPRGIGRDGAMRRRALVATEVVSDVEATEVSRVGVGWAGRSRALTPERRAEVEDFVDFLRRRERRNGVAMTALSEAAFAALWDNEEDAEYDRV